MPTLVETQWWLPLMKATITQLNLIQATPLRMKQNDAYTLEEPVTTATNASYNYLAKYDPSNSIEANPNEAYAMNITTEKNEAYKPVVHDSAECHEYDYT